MNGAESLIRTLVAGGVETCFTNPGTSEIHIVAALDRIGEMRCVLGLFEASSPERPTLRPHGGETGMHSASSRSGLSNGLANLHNASRAQVPLVNLVGQHATDHLRYDTPLTSDIEAIAQPCSKWVRTSRAPSEIGRDAVEAVLAARTAPGQIATLIVPADVAWNEGGSVASLPALRKPPMPDSQAVERAAAMLRSGARTAILIAGNGLYGKGLLAAGVSHRQRAPNYWLPTLLLGCNGARIAAGRSRAVCARTGSRAVQGISAADSGGRTGSGGVFRVSGKEQCFHFAGMCDPHVGEAWRRLRWRARRAGGSFVGTRRRSHRGTSGAADDA